MTDLASDYRPALRRRTAGSAGQGVLIGLSLGIAALVCLPILAVVSTGIAPFDVAINHLIDTLLGEIVLNTLGLMMIVGLGTAIIGVGAAWLVTMCRFPGSRLLEWALLLPLAIPAYIIGYAYTDAMAYAGPIQSSLRALFGWGRGDYWFPEVHTLAGAGAMFTLVLYPYVYLLARTAFLDQSVCVLEASRTLGAGPFAAFARVGLPMARPAIAAGVALALMEALADFGTVQYFGVHTFTTAIYRTWFGMGDRVGAAQLATGLLSFMLLLVAVEMLSRRDRRYGGDARRHRGVTALVLTGPKAAGALLFCLMPVILGFLLPVLALVRLHLDDGDPVFGARFLVYARNSFLLAGIAAVIIVTAAAALAYATRLAPASAGIVRIAALGYALPGTVIAVGILVPLGAFDNALDSFARTQFGVSTGLILSGSVIGLLYAYLVRFLAVAIGPLETGLGKIPLSIDQAARTLGLAASGVASRIHAPLLRRSMLTAGLMVFVDVLKELPATLIVRPFDFDTLAVRVYNLAADERLAQASTGALVIVAIGLLPVVVLTRMIAQDRRLGERGPPL